MAAPVSNASNTAAEALRRAAEARARAAAEAARRAAEAARRAAAAAEKRAESAQSKAAQGAQSLSRAQSSFTAAQTSLSRHPRDAGAKAKVAAAQKKVDRAQTSDAALQGRSAAALAGAVSAGDNALRLERSANQLASARHQAAPFAAADRVSDTYEGRTLSAKDQAQLFGTSLKAVPDQYGPTVASAFQAGLGRKPTAKEQARYESVMLSAVHAGQGAAGAQTAVEQTLMATREFAKKNPDYAWLKGVYASTVGTAPSLSEVAGSEKLIASAKAAGKSPADGRALVAAFLKNSPAYREGQLDPNRDDWYFQQPNGWSCGPSSLTNALAAFHLKPANADTFNMAVGLLGASAGVGTPGGASYVADRINQANLGLVAQASSSSNASDVKAALSQGYGVIANGTVLGGNSGHFVFIKGLDASGNFVMGDPWGPETAQTGPTWSEATLNQFMNGGANPPGFVTLTRAG